MTPTSPRRRRRASTLLVVGAALALLLAACGDDKKDDDSSGSNGTSKPKIRISSQDFGEQKTLAQVYGQYLKAKGYDVEIQPPIGSRTQIYAALKAGKVDLVLDYEGSAIVELKGESTSDADENHDKLVKLLEPLDLVAGARSDAADANALVALKTWADQNSVTKISDLSKVTGDLTLGGAPECATRDDCLKGYNSPDHYGLSLKFKTVAYGPPLVAALKANEIQLAQYGTTAPELADGTIVTLEDDKKLQSAENVVPVFRKDVEEDQLVKLLDELSGAITTEDLAKWNAATDVDKMDSADVAESWLTTKGLI
jgi:osmoprotectant transport system substrate-binding protein